MKEKQLMKSDSFIMNLKRKIFNFFNKKKINDEIKEPTTRVNKEELLNLYKAVKQYKVDINSLSEEELSNIIKLFKEEISIVKKKIEQDIVEININKREIEYYQKTGQHN